MRLGGLLDRYVARRFAATLLLCVASVLVLFVALDAMLRFERVSARDPAHPLWALVEHYRVQLPLMYQRFGAFLTLVGATLCVRRLEHHNELLPVVASGISVRRALLALFVGAVAMGGVQVLDSEVVIPRMADLVLRIGDLRGHAEFFGPLVVRDGAGNTLLAGSYDARQARLRWVTVRERDRDGRVVALWTADRARWNGEGWVAPRARIERRAPGAATRRRLAGEVRLPLGLRPIDLESLQGVMSVLDTRALGRQIARQPRNRSLRVQWHERFAKPLDHLVLVLLGLPFVLRRHAGRVRMFVGLVVLIGLCTLFFITGIVCHDLGVHGDLAPVWAAWAPTIGFGALGVWLVARVET